MTTKKDWRIFHKGDFILTAVGFPAFVYQNQVMKNIVDIYAFGMFDEHGSDYADKVQKITREEFMDYFGKNSLNSEYTKEYVLEKMKQFKIK